MIIMVLVQGSEDITITSYPISDEAREPVSALRDSQGACRCVATLDDRALTGWRLCAKEIALSRKALPLATTNDADRLALKWP